MKYPMGVCCAGDGKGGKHSETCRYSKAEPVEYPSSLKEDSGASCQICNKHIAHDIHNVSVYSYAHAYVPPVGSEVKPRTGDKQDFCPEIRMNSVCCGRYNENGVCQKCGITRDEPRTGEGS